MAWLRCYICIAQYWPCGVMAAPLSRPFCLRLNHLLHSTPALLLHHACLLLLAWQSCEISAPYGIVVDAAVRHRGDDRRRHRGTLHHVRRNGRPRGEIGLRGSIMATCRAVNAYIKAMASMLCVSTKRKLKSRHFSMSACNAAASWGSHRAHLMVALSPLVGQFGIASVHRRNAIGVLIARFLSIPR